MATLPGPILAASVRIAGYTIVFAFEAGWHLAHSRKDLAGAAIGRWGKAVTDAAARMFRG